MSSAIPSRPPNPFRLAALLLVGLVILRAAVPEGFMPDANAARASRFSLVLCTPSGLRTVAVDPAALPDDPAGHSDQTSERCGYSGLIPMLGGLPQAIDFRRPVYAVALERSSGHRLPFPETVFTPGLGARAPPNPD